MWKIVIVYTIFWFLVAVGAALLLQWTGILDVPDDRFDTMDRLRPPEGLFSRLVTCCLAWAACGSWLGWNQARKVAPSHDRRRWSVRLWTLLAVLLAFRFWFGWQLNLVRQRKMMLGSLQRSTESMLIYLGGANDKLNPLRRLLGDDYVSNIWFTSETNEFDEAQLRTLFPEARVAFDDPRH